MEYREHRPCDALAPFVECFWSLAADPRHAFETPDPILPDGRVEWILHLGDPVFELLPGGGSRRQPRRFVVGQMERALHIAPAGKLRCFGIRFRPAGARPVLRLPMEALRGQTVAADQIEPRLDRALGDRIDPGASFEDQVMQAERALLGQRVGRAPVDPVAHAAADAMVQSRGRIRIGDLAEELGINRRTLERRFVQEVGLPPKRFARVIRFQRIFRELRSGQVDWADLAAGSGYFDQSHLIREFRRFAGTTPTRLAWDARPLTRALAGVDPVSLPSNPIAG